MNELKAGWRNNITTAIGAVLAGLMVLQNYDVDLPPWLIPVAIAVFGYFVRDAGKTSEDSGAK